MNKQNPDANEKPAEFRNRRWQKPELKEEQYRKTKNDPPAPLLPDSPTQSSS